MTPRIEIHVIRSEGEPLYTVDVVDVDNPVNFHSYDCLYFKQGRSLEQLITELAQSEYKEILDIFKLKPFR